MGAALCGAALEFATSASRSGADIDSGVTLICHLRSASMVPRQSGEPQWQAYRCRS